MVWGEFNTIGDLFRVKEVKKIRRTRCSPFFVSYGEIKEYPTILLQTLMLQMEELMHPHRVRRKLIREG